MISRETVTRLLKGLLRLPLAVRVWLGVLVTANVLVPLVFLGRREAQVVLVTFLASVALTLALAHVAGFTRLVAAGRVLWLPLLLYLWSRMGGHPAVQLYGGWIRIVMVLNAASLARAGWDLVRYLRGEREEVMTGLESETLRRD
jgi:hypothetical protein